MFLPLTTTPKKLITNKLNTLVSNRNNSEKTKLQKLTIPSSGIREEISLKTQEKYAIRMEY